jgi:hypothetical protein
VLRTGCLQSVTSVAGHGSLPEHVLAERLLLAIYGYGTSTEAILRRFMKANATHPTYQAMIELGRVQKTIFLARYLRSRALQREIHEGLNVVESWNRANAVIFYGKGGDLATNRRDEQEMSVLCLRILQAALVYVNMLMLQDLLAEPEWADVLTAEDQRGLTPLFWSYVLPYGEVKLNMTSRLPLGTTWPVACPVGDPHAYAARRRCR